MFGELQAHGAASSARGSDCFEKGRAQTGVVFFIHFSSPTIASIYPSSATNNPMKLAISAIRNGLNFTLNTLNQGSRLSSLLALVSPRQFATTTLNMAAQEYKLKGVTSLNLNPGDKHEVEVEGLDARVLLVNAGGQVQAIGPRCTHYGAPLAKGILGTNGTITCPWHGG